jgi:hypothetical protein
VAFAGELRPGVPLKLRLSLLATPALYPEWLGDRSFLEVHGGASVCDRGHGGHRYHRDRDRNGARGHVGLSARRASPLTIEQALDEIEAVLEPDGLPWGSNSSIRRTSRT